MNTDNFHTHRLCIAPMLDWTDRHERFFLRLISPHALLYTEMVTTGAIIHGDEFHHLNFNEEEHPVALQLGGSNPEDLARCSTIAERYGYDEVNLNVGCPSDRVQSGRFGACLMGDPDLVARSIEAMQNACNIPVTVKCRIGIDDQDSYAFLVKFVDTVRQAGCKTFIIHARKAWLSGLSPKENREIPPLHYDRVYQIQTDFPDLDIIINGGISTTTDALEHVKHTKGVMVGREAYSNPYILTDMERALFNNEKLPQRTEIIESLYPYIEKQLNGRTKLNHITRHILGLFNGQPGAKQFRRYLSENAHKDNAGVEVLQHALSLVTPQDERKEL